MSGLGVSDFGYRFLRFDVCHELHRRVLLASSFSGRKIMNARYKLSLIILMTLLYSGPGIAAKDDKSGPQVLISPPVNWSQYTCSYTNLTDADLTVTPSV